MKQALALLLAVLLPFGNAFSLPPEVRQPEYLMEIIRHIYRWHLDEHDIETVLPTGEITLWLRDVTPSDLDPGDRSQLVKMGLPAFNLRIILKKTNYRIEELDINVRGDIFKIIEVARHPEGVPAPDDAVSLTMDIKVLKDYLMTTRSQKDPLHPDVAPKLRKELLQQVARDLQTHHHPIHEAHVAPLSPVANELWIFWETGRRLIRVAADIEITDPAVWKHGQLSLDIFDIDRQTVVSLAEVPGSNAYLTRDQVGRILYNCMVLGARHEIHATTEAH